MKPTSYITLFILSAVLIYSCQKDPISPNGISPVNKTRYYDQEILPDSLSELYGYWKLTNIGGGIGGVGYPVEDASFDALEIKPFGIYGYYKDSVLLEYGRVELDSYPAQYGVLVYFIADFNSNQIVYPYKKVRYIVSLNNDELSIGPYDISDGFGFGFKRLKP